jgi:hypothetical protein
MRAHQSLSRPTPVGPRAEYPRKRWHLRTCCTQGQSIQRSLVRVLPWANQCTHTESYLTPFSKIKSATAVASPNVGTSFPIWLMVRTILFGSARLSWAFALSPMITIGLSGSTLELGSAIVRRTSLERCECIPPHRPLSDDKTTKSLRLRGSVGVAFWKISSCKRIR